MFKSTSTFIIFLKIEHNQAPIQNARTFFTYISQCKNLKVIISWPRVSKHQVRLQAELTQYLIDGFIDFPLCCTQWEVRLHPTSACEPDFICSTINIKSIFVFNVYFTCEAWFTVLSLLENSSHWNFPVHLPENSSKTKI